MKPIPPTQRRDWFLTALFAALIIPELLPDESLPLWAQLVPMIVAVGFIPVRRTMPLVAVCVVSITAATCLWIALRDVDVENVGSLGGLAGILLIYCLCRWASPRDIAIGFVVSAGCEVVADIAGGGLDRADAVFVLPWLVVAGFALAMRFRAQMIVERENQIRLVERNALARELHDTVAHHVSAIAVQAQAGQYVAGSNPEAAVETLRTIERIANDSIDEMRRTVGILRSDADHERTAAATSLDVLSAPHERPAIHVVGTTRLDDLPAGVGAALFRIAQESITNARRHSRNASFVEVSVTRRDNLVEMIVDNDGTPTTRNSGSGFGQIGMKERVDALGGTFETGARPANGWRTTTSIPLKLAEL